MCVCVCVCVYTYIYICVCVCVWAWRGACIPACLFVSWDVINERQPATRLVHNVTGIWRSTPRVCMNISPCRRKAEGRGGGAMDSG